VVAVAAGGTHALALRENGTIVAWGNNSAGQTNVPTNLSNVMAVAAGAAHSLALKNDGTVVAWGDNTYGQTNVVTNLPPVKFIAAGANHSFAGVGNYSLNGVLVAPIQYRVDPAKDLLLIYNSSSTNSIWVKDYYLANRPMASNANVLGIACPTNEITDDVTFTNQILTPYRNWLNQNPTKHPQYLILFLDIPSRVHNTNGANVTSTSMRIYQETLGIKPFVTHINMNGTNDCRAYIDKLRFFGTNYSPGKVIISASANGSYSNTNYVVDNVRHDDYPSEYHASFVRAATNGLLSVGVPAQSILYAEDLEPCLGRNELLECTNGYQAKIHLTNVVDVAGYISWGFHTTLEVWTPEKVKWTGNSGWWLIETLESYNGQRSYAGLDGLFLRWFSSSAFGGTNYSNTPVGAVTHVDEPGLAGVNDSAEYFGLWVNGKNFAICAWYSRETLFFQAVGDPLVRR
jgi:hypothetical protein